MIYACLNDMFGLTLGPIGQFALNWMLLWCCLVSLLGAVVEVLLEERERVRRMSLLKATLHADPLDPGVRVVRVLRSWEVRR